MEKAWPFAAQWGFKADDDLVDKAVHAIIDKATFAADETKCRGRLPVDLFSFLNAVGGGGQSSAALGSFLGQSAHLVAELKVDKNAMSSQDVATLRKNVPVLSVRMGDLMARMALGGGEADSAQTELQLTVPWLFVPNDRGELLPLSARPDAVTRHGSHMTAIEFFTTYGDTGGRDKLKEMLYSTPFGATLHNAAKHAEFWKRSLCKRKVAQASLQALAAWKLLNPGAASIAVINASTPPGAHRTVSVVRGAKMTAPFSPADAFRLACILVWETGVVESGRYSIKLNQPTLADDDAFLDLLAKNVEDHRDPFHGIRVRNGKWKGAKVVVDREVGKIEPEAFVGGNGLPFNDDAATRVVKWKRLGPHRSTVEKLADLKEKYGDSAMEALDLAWNHGREARFLEGDVVEVLYPEIDGGKKFEGVVVSVVNENNPTSIDVQWEDNTTTTIKRNQFNLVTMVEPTPGP